MHGKPDNRHTRYWARHSCELVLSFLVMSMTPPFPPTLAPADPLDFAHNVFIFVMNYMCYLILEADKATRSLGEEAVKGQSWNIPIPPSVFAVERSF